MELRIAGEIERSSLIDCCEIIIRLSVTRGGESERELLFRADVQLTHD